MLTVDLNTAPGRAIRTIASNDCYELLYNEVENRIYLTVNGFWKSPAAVPEYLHDWEKALLLSKVNFTLLADFRGMITHPQELNSLHIAVLKLVKAHGLLQFACVAPDDKIASLQVAAICEESGIEPHIFSSPEDAHEFLNTSAASYQQV
ncbi:hypothetical protein [Pontibacter liquoris]|uniref:hypothetical protein n=1 Tax=Pontibacter liquoris TaxID=2905677 RepID=UPI001FA71FB7|nr:hypothetical protein [Pontibacter liquoris]